VRQALDPGGIIRPRRRRGCTNIVINSLAASKLLIANRPATALDVTIQAKIVAAARPGHVRSVHHPRYGGAEIADRTVVMFNDDVIEKGPTEEIFEHPANPNTKARLSAVPRLGSA
jgi:peptide/nickel transport system ATP-binding protein